MSPVFAHGQLRLYLLSLLEEAPRHGYEVIRALEDRFEGMYAPSAGTIYPRLARLEEEGLVVRTDEGRKAVYRITDAGRAELASRRADVHELEEELTRSVRRMAERVRAEVHGSASDLRAELKAAAREARRHAHEPGQVTGQAEHGPGDDSGRSGWGSARARDVEGLLQRLRDEARHAVRSSGVTEHTVTQVREALDDALNTIERAIRGERHGERRGGDRPGDEAPGDQRPVDERPADRDDEEGGDARR
jgi:DNA-binding PadR family transcriptional regulator